MNSKKRPAWLSSEVGVDPGPPRNLAPGGAKTVAVVLGSGGVTPNPHRYGPSAAIIVNNTPYLIDAGEGIWRGLAWAAVNHPELIGEHLEPRRITKLFLTHLHSDHTVGLPAVWLLPWAYGREDPLVPLAGGIDTAKHIPGARLEIIEGMGHNFPVELWPTIIGLVTDHAKGPETT